MPRTTTRSPYVVFPPLSVSTSTTNAKEKSKGEREKKIKVCAVVKGKFGDL